MITKTIAWGDGTGTNITVRYSGNGTEVVSVQSDPNTTTSTRRKTFTVVAGTSVVTVQVVQAPRAAATAVVITATPMMREDRNGALVWALTFDTQPWMPCGFYVSGYLYFSSGEVAAFDGYIADGENVVYTSYTDTDDTPFGGVVDATADDVGYVVDSAEIVI